MRIMVTGAQGQVGSALAQLGNELGLDLIALGRTELDITDSESISESFEKHRPDLLINAAAYTAVDRAECEAELAYEINEMATALLAYACAASDIPMLHISTDYVFDGSKGGAYTEDDPVNPLSVYAKSKEAGECVLRELVDRHIILRTSWLFGVHGNNFVKTIVRKAKDSACLNVVCDQYGGPTSARSISQALLMIAGQFDKVGQAPWGTYHFCQKPYVSWHQFAQEIIELATEMGMLDHEVEVVRIPSLDFASPAWRPANSRLDTVKYENSFNASVSYWTEDLETVLRSL